MEIAEAVLDVVEEGRRVTTKKGASGGGKERD